MRRLNIDTSHSALFILRVMPRLLINIQGKEYYWCCPKCRCLIAQKDRSKPHTQKYCYRCKEWYLIP